MRTLYVVTHPEATHHVEGLVGGWFDSALTDHGERDAAAIALELKRRIPADAVVDVVSSDLKHTTQAAEAIASRLQVLPLLHDGMREASYGEAEGWPQAWLDERFVPSPATGERMNHWDRIPGSRPSFNSPLACTPTSKTSWHARPPTRHRDARFAGRFVLAGWIKMSI